MFKTRSKTDNTSVAQSAEKESEARIAAAAHHLGLVGLKNRRLVGNAQMMQLQRAVGNQAIVQLSARAEQLRRPLQRMSEEEARAAFPVDWETNLRPALTTMAYQSGKTLVDFLAKMSNEDLAQHVAKLAAPPAEEYAGFSRVRNKSGLTGIFAYNPVKNMEYLKGFQSSYTAGSLTLYRGLNVSHFSWTALRGGSLFGDGSKDDPTFTGDPGATTRWIPFADDREIASKIACFIPKQMVAIYSNEQRLLPLGLVLKMNVPVGFPIAYMNEGEQLVRGPITPADGLRVELLSFACGTRREVRPLRLSLWDLPPQGPWDVTYDQAEEWRCRADAWMQRFLPRPSGIRTAGHNRWLPGM